MVGIVQPAGEQAQQWLVQHAPTSEQVLAPDELYSSQQEEVYRSPVDVQSTAVRATTSPVAVDGENWILLLLELQGQELGWKTLVSDGGKAIGEGV